MLKHKIKVCVACLVLIQMMDSFNAFSQLNMPSSRYFLNSYLANPSYAGLERGVKIDAIYQGNLNKVEHAPINQSLTADMGINDKIGVGLNVNYAKAGLFTNTQISASYAYHLPLQSEKQNLNFGLSLGVNVNHVSNNYVGGINDPLIQGDYYNKTSPDADFGVSYTSETIELQAAAYRFISSLKGNEFNSVLNNNAYYMSASYKIIQQDFVLVPQVGYNKIRNMDDVFDIGTEINVFDKQFKVLAMYHSNNSYTWGAGLNCLSKLNLLIVYNVPPKGFRSYSNQMFELALQYSFRK